MKLITETSNPFVHLAVLAANNKGDFDRSTFSLIETLINNDFHLKYDINEQFVVQDISNTTYSSSNIQYKTNFFNCTFILGNSFNPQLINKLVACGLQFDPFNKKVKNNTDINTDIDGDDSNTYIDDNNINDILFTRTELDEKRNIFLLKLFLKQQGIEKFTEQIAKCNTLHKAVVTNRLDLVKYILDNVSVDLKNVNLETPIMYAKNLETLQLLSQYNPDWSVKTALGNDCSYYYSGIGDDNIKKELVNFYLDKLSNNNSTIDVLSADIIDEKIKITLLNMVEKDSTKAELNDFIKKHKPKDFENITNKNNRTLGHILIAKGDYARSDLFPKTDLYHVDNSGYNIFSHLLLSGNLSDTKTKLAKQIMLSCLENPEKNMNEKVFNRLINIGLEDNRYAQQDIASWVLKDNFIRKEILSVFDKEPTECNFDMYSTKNSTLSSEQHKKFYFNLFSNLMNKYEIKDLNPDSILKKFININDYNQTYQISFNKNYMNNLLVLINEYSDVQNTSLHDILEKTFSNINEQFYDLLSKNKIFGKTTFETNDEFFAECKKDFYCDFAIPFFEFLAKSHIDNIIVNISKDIVTDINDFIRHDDRSEILSEQLDYFNKKHSYLVLNENLTPRKISQKPGKI